MEWDKKRITLFIKFKRIMPTGIYKRKPCSEETKIKISIANKGKIVSEKSRKKMSKARKGIKLSEEHKKKLVKHGLSKTRFYKIFDCARYRCKGRTDKDFRTYYSKGIKFLWKSFEDFIEDMYTSYIKHCEEYGKKNTTIDRIDGNGNYCKENCRWATYKLQNRNKSNNKLFLVDDKKITKVELAEKLNISPENLYYKLKSGVTLKKLLNMKQDVKSKTNRN